MKEGINKEGALLELLSMQRSTHVFVVGRPSFPMKSTVVLSPLMSPSVAYESHPGGADSRTLERCCCCCRRRGGSIAFPRLLAPIMRSLQLNSKQVQALVIRERHSALSNARASSSPGGMPSYLRRSLIEFLNRFLGRPSGREPWTSYPYSIWRGRRELSILLTYPVHRSWAFSIWASILTRPVLSRTSRLGALSCQLVPMFYTCINMFND